MANTESIELSVEEAGPCRKKVSVKIPPARVSAEFEKSLRQWAQSVPIPGFRQGKAPRTLIERRFGKQVAVEVKQTLVDAALSQAFDDKNLSPIANPELDAEALEVSKDAALDFDFTVFVKPEFELPPLDGIAVEAPTADPSDSQLEGTVDRFRRRKATLRPVEDKIENGDVVTLNVVGSSDGEERTRLDEAQYEVGSRFVGELVSEDLDEFLVGQQTGATGTAKGVVAPWLQDHPLAGTEMEIAVEVLDHKRPELPELDDAFAKEFDFDSKDEFLEALKRQIRQSNEEERNRFIENAALAQLVEKTEIDLPEELIARELDELALRAATDMQMEGKAEDEIAKRVAEVREQRRDQSVRELKGWFVVDKIVEKERIIVPESEVREAVAQIAQHQNQSPDAMYELLRDAGRLSGLRNQLREKKARGLLRTKVTVTDLDPEASAADEDGAGTGTAAKKKAQKKTAKKKTAKKSEKKTTKKAAAKKAKKKDD